MLCRFVAAVAVLAGAVLTSPLRAPVAPCPPNTLPGERVFIASNESCAEFYECSNGIAYNFTCPSGLYFNTNTSQCDFPWNVNCTEPTAAPEPSTENPAGSTVAPEPFLLLAELTFDAPDCPADAVHPTFFPNPDNCSTFFMCSNGQPFLRPCPPGLFFNPQKEVCDYPENVDCVQPTEAPDNSTSEDFLELMMMELDAESVCPETDGLYPVLLPNPANCSTYFLCSHGVPILRPCPAGLFFNNNTWTCDYPGNVECVQPTESPVDNSTVQPDLEILALMLDTEDEPECPEVDGKFPVLLPNPANCSAYFVCSHGRPVPMPCPAGLFFNNDTWSCDYPENVDCVQPTPSPDNLTVSADLVLTALEVSDDIPTCPAVDGKYPVLFPNPANCSTFFMCSNGVPYLKQCPKYLYFNNDTWSCDYPENVDCVQPSPAPVNVSAQLEYLSLVAIGEADDTPTCPVVDGKYPVLIPNPANCSTFFMCSHGIPYLKECPEYLYFNNDTWTCDYPENVDCVQPTGAPVPTPDSLHLNFDADVQCPEPVNDTEVVLIPDPEDCHGFYFCANQIPIRFHCPSDLYFNPDTDRCDYQENVNCTSSQL